MAELWKQFEGEVVDGKLLLQEYLGGNDAQGVFLTALGDPEPRKAAIKLIREDTRGSKRRLQPWKFAEKLSHPHLMRLLGSGRTELRGEAMLYVVMELAEENLAEVIPHRALTGEEAREMLEPALASMAYLHGEGFVHGHLKPSNILAVDGKLRISSDHLCRTGDQPEQPDPYAPPEMDLEGFSPPGDVWSLGITLVEALTQSRPTWKGTAPEEPTLPDSLPQPLLDIARNCLKRNPRSRWRVADIQKRLRESGPPVSRPVQEEQRGAPKRLIFVLSAVLTVILALVLFGPRIFDRVESSNIPPETIPAQQPSQPAVASRAESKPVQPVGGTTAEKRQPEPPPKATTPPPVAVVPPPVVPPPVVAKPKEQEPSPAPVTSAGIQKVLPDINPGARRSIQGRVRVTVRVQVDSSGKVVDARLESPGPSKYFADAALQATRRWRFAPGSETQYDVQYVFKRDETTATPGRVGGQ